MKTTISHTTEIKVSAVDETTSEMHVTWRNPWHAGTPRKIRMNLDDVLRLFMGMVEPKSP